MTFVSNAPTRTCCGEPPGRCRCPVDQDGLEPLPTMNAVLAADLRAAEPKGGRARPVDQDGLEPLPTWDGR